MKNMSSTPAMKADMIIIPIRLAGLVALSPWSSSLHHVLDSGRRKDVTVKQGQRLVVRDQNARCAKRRKVRVHLLADGESVCWAIAVGESFVSVRLDKTFGRGF